MVGEFLKIDQKPAKNRVMISVVIFALVAVILYIAKSDPKGFDILWRYFAWSNQTLAVFAFAIITIYLLARGYTTAPIMALIPGAWYTFITVSFICNVPIGFGLAYNVSMSIGVVVALLYSVVIWKKGTQMHANKTPIEAPATY